MMYFLSKQPCRCGLEYIDSRIIRSPPPTIQKGILGGTLNCIWLLGSISDAEGRLSTSPLLLPLAPLCPGVVAAVRLINWL